MLSESLLREELGFSRTPVREAIGRLAQEGLVRVYPKRGIMVSPSQSATYTKFLKSALSSSLTR